MHRECGGECVPRLDQSGFWHSTRLPAQGLDWEAEHRPTMFSILESDLELQAVSSLATQPDEVGFDVKTVSVFQVAHELLANEDGQQFGWVGNYVAHGFGL